jgi:Flp pilus assembly pilin Flp
MAKKNAFGRVRRRSSTLPMIKTLVRLVREDDGQDVIEYALLTAGIGIVSVATWPLIETGIKNAYEALDAHTQDEWEVPNPGSN